MVLLHLRPISQEMLAITIRKMNLKKIRVIALCFRLNIYIYIDIDMNMHIHIHITRTNFGKLLLYPSEHISVKYKSQ